MPRRSRILPVGLAAAFLFAAIAAAGPLSAAVPTADEPAAAAERLVNEALRDELAGDSSERLLLLSRAIQADPQCAPARWHAGQVSHNGQWVDYTRVPALLATEQAVQEYRALRAEAALDNPGQPTAAGHLRMADWCRDQDLKARERAHLTAALALSPGLDSPALRQRLGQTWTGGEWVSPSDRQRAAEQQRQLQDDLQAWLPRLKLLSARLDSPQRETARAAREKLLSITDPAALPALEQSLSDQPEHARLLVEVLAGMPSHRSADFLARQAVLSPFKSVRQVAAEALRKRPPESYAPELLAAMQTPIEARASLFVSTCGVQILQEFQSEDQHASVRVRTGSSVTLIPTAIVVSRMRQSVKLRPFRPREMDSLGYSQHLAAARQAAVAEAETRIALTQSEIAARNTALREFNALFTEALATATGTEKQTEPEVWWRWWLEYNQLAEHDKPEAYAEFCKEYVKCVPVKITYCSCLVAGTPVWTDRGAVPVEQVQVGDLVLAKSPETGELAYKPVLRTTVRDATSVLRVTTDGSEFRATGGHTFWISGRGWTKIRDAQPGEPFHGVSGPVEVQSVEPAGKAKTYNLVTEDFHTYFVGPDMLLSHDVTFAEPLDAPVPGLAAP